MQEADSAKVTLRFAAELIRGSLASLKLKKSRLALKTALRYSVRQPIVGIKIGVLEVMLLRILRGIRIAGDGEGEIETADKSRVPNFFYRIGNRNICQRKTKGESGVSYIDYGIGDCDTGQGETVAKDPIIDLCY